MSHWKRKVAASLAATLILTTAPAHALWWMATEVTQWMNHGLMVDKLGEQVRTVSQLVETYRTNVTQLEELVRAGKSLDGLTLPQVLGIKQDLDNYQSALRGFGRDLGSLRNVFDTRLTEARLQNIDFRQYMQAENDRISSGNRAAQARVAREMRILEQVRRDAELVSEYGNKIPGTVGVHQAAQLLNAQTNLALQQINQLVAMKAEEQGGDKADELAKRAQRRAGALEAQKGIGSAQDNVETLNEQLIRSMRQMRN
ncbi:MAG: hypothetical protein AB7L71_02650 [Vicinamibacterales bacterium]